MGKHIPIDDLFREKLSDGEEQLNLGAWANMERMLDGKNPYADEEKRKRRILPFILLFTLLSGVVTAGYVVLTKGKTKSTETHSEIASVEAKNQQSTSQTSLKSNVETNHNAETVLTPSTTKPNEKTPENTSHAHKESTSKVKAQTLNQSSQSSLEATSKEAFASTQSTLPAGTLAKAKNIGKSNEAKEKMDKPSKEKLAMDSPNKKSNTNAKESNSNVEPSTAKETINQFDLQQKIKMDRAGNPIVELDTLSKAQYSVENEAETMAARPTLTPDETNPRLVNLTPEQELAINASAPAQISASSAPSTPALITVKEKPTLQHPEIKHSKPEQESFFTKFRNFAAVNMQKMSLVTTSLINMGYPMIPGISVGVNAAIFNPKNNFGGFHIGVNNLKPVSERFSILSELIYFIRNNSGYTIDDITTLNKNISSDNVTLASQNKTIYTYQVDSTVSNYNFKNFSSIEMPVKLQAHFRSFTAYGGLNMAYIFRLNVKENKKNYVLNKEEILDNNVNFYPKEELLKRYSRDDFSSRFGLGYTVGASLSLSPNLYIDARLTQNVWDNAKSTAAREVSAGYFKVPTVQLSLGYRFKKFTPND
jgi:hypothetical protein